MAAQTRPLRHRLALAGLCALLLGAASVMQPTVARADATISGFSPTSGPIGSKVTITGSGFVSGSTSVQFNGHTASISSITSTTIVATVPTFATSGPISVTVSGTPTATSASSFTVTTGIYTGITAANPGSSFAVFGGGYPAHRAIDVKLVGSGGEPIVASTSSDGTGDWSVTAAIPPSTTAALYTLLASTPDGTAASQALTVRADAPQIGFSGRHRGGQPYETALGPSTIPSADLDWAASPAGLDAPFVVAGGWMYYMGTDSNLHQVNAATGANGFSVAAGMNGGIPAVYGSTIVTATLTNVRAFNTSGAMLWNIACPCNGSNLDTGTVAIANGLVFIGSADGLVHAFQLSNGSPVWTENGFGSRPAPSSFVSGLAVQGHVLVALTGDGTLWGIDATTGAFKWNMPASGSGADYLSATDEQPIIGDGMACAAAKGFETCVWTANGSYAFSVPSSSSVMAPFSTPAMDGGMLFFGTWNGYLVAVKGDGTTAWKTVDPHGHGNPTAPDIYTTAPFVANGVVYALDRAGVVTAFDESSGAVLWTGSTGGSLNNNWTPTISVVNGVVYAEQGGQIAAFDLAGGRN